MIDNKRCEGCLTYRTLEGDYLAYCTFVGYNDGRCPCTQCIVKPMCEDTCESFEVFRAEVTRPEMSHE